MFVCRSLVALIKSRLRVCVSIQHFVCAHCEKAFEGRRHFEKKGMAYCERDYKFVSPCLPVSITLYILFISVSVFSLSCLVMCASRATSLAAVMVSYGICVWVSLCVCVCVCVLPCSGECAQQELVRSTLSLHVL